VRSPNERHILSNVDEETRTADCSICGPGVKMWKGGRLRRRWRCASRVAAQASRRRDLNPARTRITKMRANGVNITLEQFQALTVEANGHCQLCNRECSLHVDHDHETGEVRGLLCSTCNTGLGKFGDDPERLDRAAAYIRKRTATAIGT
jgi:hypothetical protein